MSRKDTHESKVHKIIKHDFIENLFLISLYSFQ